MSGSFPCDNLVFSLLLVSFSLIFFFAASHRCYALSYITSYHVVFVICVQSRPALSLLGYCHYQLQDFVNAADCYEQLTILNPEVDDYRLYYAQSLYKAHLFDEAMKVSSQIDESVYHDKV